MSSIVYNTTDEIIEILSNHNYTQGIVVVGSIGMSLYFIEMIMIIVWIIVNRVHIGIFMWKSKDAIQKYKIKIPHFIFIPLLFICLYKFLSIPIVLYRQITLTVGPEIICFILFDMSVYDAVFGFLLLIICRSIIPPIEIISAKVVLVVKTCRVIISLCIITMVLNTVFTTVIIFTVQPLDVFGLLMYIISLPIIGITRVLLLVIAVSISIALLYLNKTGDRILNIKIFVVLVLCVCTYIFYIVFVPLAYVFGMIILVVLHIAPGIVVNLIIIVAFAPNMYSWRTCLHVK